MSPIRRRTATAIPGVRSRPVAALRWLASALGVIVALYLAASLVLPLVPGPRADLPPGDDLRIGLVHGPIHYDFLLPLDPATRARFAFAASGGVRVDDPGAEWLLLGHGGRAFYTTVGTYADLSLHAVWEGVTGDASVLRLEVLGPLRQDAPIRWLSLSRAQYAALLDALTRDLRRADGLPVPVPGPGLSDRDAFFEETTRSDIFRTCNVWSGAALRQAGVSFGLWTPATWSVALSLWRFSP